MFEWVKVFMPLITTLISLLLAWFVGNRISMVWAIRQKQREFQLTTRADFYRSYGEFFSIWKLWNFYKRNATKVAFPANVHWEVLQRACAAEAGVEALLVRVASERSLSPGDLGNLARFRHAYQTLRVTIRRDQELPWTTSSHPEYISFKTHAARVALLLDTAPFLPKKDADAAAGNLIEITDNRWADAWVLHAGEGPVPTGSPGGGPVPTGSPGGGSVPTGSPGGGPSASRLPPNQAESDF